MLRWLIQTDGDHPALAHGIPPRGLLSAGEQAEFAALATAKRRHDWLLGRWTAKQLIRQVIDAAGAADVPLDEIEIGRLAGGAPVVAGYPLTLSISHSGDSAFCAVWPAAWGPLGADLERIESRLPAFASDYFNERELAALSRLAVEDPGVQRRDTLTTAIWSAKEATLKALQLGLAVDTRRVSCQIRPSTPLPATAWQPFTIMLDRQHLGAHAPRLAGWWRTYQGFVLTLAGAHRFAVKERPHDEN